MIHTGESQIINGRLYHLAKDRYGALWLCHRFTPGGLLTQLFGPIIPDSAKSRNENNTSNDLYIDAGREMAAKIKTRSNAGKRIKAPLEP